MTTKSKRVPVNAWGAAIYKDAVATPAYAVWKPGYTPHEAVVKAIVRKNPGMDFFALRREGETPNTIHFTVTLINRAQQGFDIQFAIDRSFYETVPMPRGDGAWTGATQTATYAAFAA